MACIRSVLSLSLLAALTASSLGCRGPGQYKIYRVANADAQESAGCYPGSNPGPEITGDSSTFRSGQTFGLFAVDRDTYFLDLELVSLEGSRDGRDYSFEGEQVDVQVNGDATTTVTTVLSVNLELRRRQISGTSVLDVTTNCSGTGCPNPSTGQCVTTIDFVGAEVVGAELEHPI